MKLKTVFINLDFIYRKENQSHEHRSSALSWERRRSHHVDKFYSCFYRNHSFARFWCSIHTSTCLRRRCCLIYDYVVRWSWNKSIETRFMFVSNDDAEVFELFVSWLYKRKMKFINATMKNKKDSNDFLKNHYSIIDSYSELYFMIEKRELMTLKNHIIKTRRTQKSCSIVLWSSFRATRKNMSLSLSQKRRSSFIRKA